MATKMTDEDRHVSIEFRDRKKRLRVQRLAVSDGNYADIYYVCNNCDELRYVFTGRYHLRQRPFKNILTDQNF